MTPEGELRRRSFQPAGARRKNAPFVLKPGESWPREQADHEQTERSESGGMGLNELFRLKPGTFKVRVTYHDEQGPTPLKIVSPQVTFKVNPPD